MTVLADKSDRRPGPPTTDKGSADHSPMGEALRSIYQKTVEEEVPDEFRDLLGKLD